MNATTRPALATSTALSTPVAAPAAKTARRRPAGAPASPPPNKTAPDRPVMTMNPTQYPTLRKALDEIEAAVWLVEEGVKLFDLDGAEACMAFIKDGLDAQIKRALKQMEIAQKATLAIAPRLSREDATRAVVHHLVRDGRHEVAEADMPALVRAYEAESAQAEPNTTCGIVLDRALRRMKAELPA